MVKNIALSTYQSDKSQQEEIHHKKHKATYTAHKKHPADLARIFHGNLSRGAVQPDVNKKDDGLR